MAGVSFGQDGLIQAVRTHLASDGFVVISGFPAEPAEALIRFGQIWGTVVDKAVTSPGAENVQIHEVTPLPEPMLDAYGQAIVSTTDLEFRCHTDDFFHPKPSDLVMLLCVRRASAGGDSIVARVDDVSDRLPDGSILELQRPIFPAPFGTVPILSRADGGWRIRHNPMEMAKAMREGGLTLPDAATVALRRLDQATYEVAQQFTLEAGDCLVLDNARVLHGRTAFSDKNRLLRRVKVNL